MRLQSTQFPAVAVFAAASTFGFAVTAPAQEAPVISRDELQAEAPNSVSYTHLTLPTICSV